MALDCIFNVTGLANNTFHGSFITNFISIEFLILCIVPLHVQLVTACAKLYKLYFYKHFTITVKRICHVLKIIHRLYRVARQCHQFYAPKRRSKRIKQGLSQQLIQTTPPTDECIPVLQTRPILILMEPPSLLAPPTPQTPALQQGRATEEFKAETVSEPFTPAEDRFLGNETPIREVQPLLGTTHRENLQLWNRNSPEDISDVLGTTAYQGYVNTPLQTLDGIVVQQPKRFLPLVEEAKRLAEEIRIENGMKSGPAYFMKSS